jgi:hypothetical protein
MNGLLIASTTFDELFETVMAGVPNDEIIPVLNSLSPDNRQALLCTICSIHDEIERNSQEHGRDVRLLLQFQCPLFRDGIASCLLDDPIWQP